MEVDLDLADRLDAGRLELGGREVEGLVGFLAGRDGTREKIRDVVVVDDEGSAADSDVRVGVVFDAELDDVAPDGVGGVFGRGERIGPEEVAAEVAESADEICG